MVVICRADFSHMVVVIKKWNDGSSKIEIRLNRRKKKELLIVFVLIFFLFCQFFESFFIKF